MRRKLPEPCFACGSEFMWGCPWCSPKKQSPTFPGMDKHREDDEQFLRELMRTAEQRQHREVVNHRQDAEDYE